MRVNKQVIGSVQTNKAKANKESKTLYFEAATQKRSSMVPCVLADIGTKV